MQKILIVDDEASYRSLIQQLLQSLGYQTESAVSGYEALEKLTDDIDLVLLDVMMSGMDGFETTRRIRAHPTLGDIPIVMVTGLSGKTERLRAVEVGANDFIAKPVDLSELRIRLGCLLKVKAAQDVLRQQQAQLEAIIEERTATLQQASRRLQALLEVASTLNSSLDLDAILQHILSQATELLHAESASVMLLDEEKTRLRVTAASGPRSEAVMGREQELGSGVAGWVALHGEPLLLHGALADPRFQTSHLRRDVQDAICVPLQTSDEILGVINVSNRRDARPFVPADLELMQALAHQAVISIQNANAFESLEWQRHTVERLLHELSRAQQEERGRIAREIHDGPAQTFFAALRSAQVVRAHLRAGRDPQQVAADLEATLRQGVAEIRAVMLDLRLPSVDSEPLSSVLGTYTRRFEERTGIRTQLICQGETQGLPTTVETCLYRIAQEALVNISKHAQAGQCWVKLEVQEALCVLEVRDNGKGFEIAVAEAEAAEHLGMSLLKERATLAGGRLTVTTAPGAGTSVKVTVPLSGSGNPGSEKTS